MELDPAAAPAASSRFYLVVGLSSHRVHGTGWLAAPLIQEGAEAMQFALSRRIRKALFKNESEKLVWGDVGRAGCQFNTVWFARARARTRNAFQFPSQPRYRHGLSY